MGGGNWNNNHPRGHNSVGKEEGKIDTFCLRGGLYMERSDMSICLGNNISPTTENNKQRYIAKNAIINIWMLWLCMYMHDLHMINADKQTYLTQTNPRITNGHSANISTRRAEPTGELSWNNPSKMKINHQGYQTLSQSCTCWGYKEDVFKSSERK
jgi:hypothetical protein